MPENNKMQNLLDIVTESNINQPLNENYAEQVAQDLIDSGYAATSEKDLISMIYNKVKHDPQVSGLMNDPDFLSDTISNYNYLLKQSPIGDYDYDGELAATRAWNELHGDEDLNEDFDEIDHVFAPGDLVDLDPNLGGEGIIVAARSNYVVVKLGNGKLKTMNPSDITPQDNGISREYNPDDESTAVDYDDSEPSELRFESDGQSTPDSLKKERLRRQFDAAFGAKSPGKKPKVFKEGLAKTIKKGIKKVKRGLAGWEDNDWSDGPNDMMHRHTDYDTDTLHKLKNKPGRIAGKGSPQELQQKLINRQLRKRGEKDTPTNEGNFRRREQNAGLDQDPVHPDDVRTRRTTSYGGGPSSRDEWDRPDSNNSNNTGRVKVTINGRYWKTMPRAKAAAVKRTIEAQGKTVTLTMENKKKSSKGQSVYLGVASHRLESRMDVERFNYTVKQMGAQAVIGNHSDDAYRFTIPNTSVASVNQAMTKLLGHLQDVTIKPADLDEAVLPSDNLPSDNPGSQNQQAQTQAPGAQTGVDVAQQAQTGVSNSSDDLQDLISKLNEPEVTDTLQTMMNPEDQPQGMQNNSTDLQDDEMAQLKQLLGMMK